MVVRLGIYVLITAMLIVACSSPDPQQQKIVAQTISAIQSAPPVSEDTVLPADSEPEDSTQYYVDSFKVKMDSLMTARIELPPVYQREIFHENKEATDKFAKLSKACGGKMKVLVNSSTVVQELENTIRSTAAPESDLVILLDRTGSMYDEIAYVKKGIVQIIDTIKKYKGTRVAIATYGDKNWDWCPWFTFKNFETDYEAAIAWVNNVQVVGNCDWPESVYDAVVKCIESDFWRSQKKRNIILVGDAPPQEKPLSDYSLDEVIAKTRSTNVRMNFYPILVMPEIHEVRLSQEDKDKYKEIKNNTKLYPNPSRGVINLSMDNTATYYLELYNSNGEIVYNEEFFGITWTKDCSGLPNGMYIMRVINADHTYELIKFILQH